MSRSWRGVRDGTPLHGKSLCTSCENSHIIKGEAISETMVWCEAMIYKPILVPWRTVTECSSFRNKNTPSLHRMEKMAYVLQTDKLGKPIGFVQAAQFRKDSGMDPVDDLVVDQ